jgi:hypothetical protein
VVADGDGFGCRSDGATQKFNCVLLFHTHSLTEV